MHLLAATSGTVGDGEEAVDLAQSPAEVLILSAADSELAALSRARALLGERAPALRLVPLALLRHNLSVDLWLDRTARHARLIIARILGGAAYWPYGVEELQALAAAHDIHLALLPGGRILDEELMRRSTLPMPVCEAMRALLAAGGVDNAARLLAYAADILARGPRAAVRPAPQPLPPAGVWLDGRMHADIAALPAADEAAGTGRAWIVFYRALLEGGFTAPVDELAAALRARGLAVLPLFVTSPKEGPARAFLETALKTAPPDVIVDATAFAAGDDDILRRADCPVIQAILATRDRDAWLADPQGLPPRDLAMHVALPELDGRIIGRAVSFKSDAWRDEAAQCAIVTSRPDRRGIAWTADLAARWAALRRTPPGRKRLAIVLANYPNRDARIGNGVGYDTPASTLRILRALRRAGYDVRDIPADGDALIRRLLAGPTNADGARGRTSKARLSVNEYQRYFSELDENIRKQVTERWGPPENDPFCRDGVFHLPVVAFGGVVVGIQPARGYNIDPAATYHDPALVPPHGYLAFYIWLRETFRADAVIHNGKHGNLEWLPGKALALSAACFPDAVLGPLPHLYPFIVNDPGEGAQAKRRTQAVIIDHLVPPLARAGTYGRLAELERLLDEYWQAAGMDARRLAPLRRDILDLAHAAGLDADAGIADADEEEALVRLDAFLCEVKEAQIRNGLHILGHLPRGVELAEFLLALVRV
ncbi:MAG TPA: cobaltochelatase subunit CobN, partial [Thermopetrobacter sp.]|nr:cobaltochelatase subunit CobN [Thermopetrobacter sp.]